MAHQLDFVSGLLVAKNFQQAAHVLNKILKKQPDDLHAKVLKCGALRGLGHEAEADQLLDAVCAACEAQQADTAALQALESHCRAARLHARLARVYEAVLARPGHNIHRQLALRSKLFECYVLIGDSRKQQQQAILLYKLSPRNIYYCWTVISMLLEEGTDKSEIAEKMFEKLKGEKSQQEKYLQLRILERRGKLEEALELVKSSNIIINNNQDKLLELNMKLNHWEAAMEILKTKLLSSPDSWLDWMRYLDSVSSSGANEDNAIKFITELSNAHPKLRGPRLAEIEFYKRNPKDRNLPGLITDYFKTFSDKPICVSDLKSYLDLLTDSDRALVINNISCETNLLENQKKLGALRHLSVLKLTCLLGGYDNLDVSAREKLSHDLAQCFNASTDIDSSYYIVMRAHVLHSLFKDTGNFRYLVDAVSYIETALGVSPRSAPLLLIAVRLYLQLGAGDAAFHFYKLLGIQNVQVDSMAHVFLTKLPSTGLLGRSSNLWMAALVTLTEMLVDSADLLLWCYAEEHLDRVEELTKMMKRVERTLNRPLLRVERVYLDLLMGSTVLKSGIPIDWQACVDNRDVDVLPRWLTPLSERNIDVRSFKELRCYAIIREATISCLATGLTYIKSHQSGNRSVFQETLHAVRKLHEDFQREPVTWPEEIGLPLPTKLKAWLDSPVLSLLSSIQDFDRPEVFLSSVKDVMRWLKDSLSNISFYSLGPCLENFVIALELISIAVLICGTGRVDERVISGVEEIILQMDNLVASWTDMPCINGSTECLKDIERVHNKLKTSHQLAVDDLRRALRKKITYLHKINKT